MTQTDCSTVVPSASTANSASKELWTPPFYLAKVREVLGDIDLDPFSCMGANVMVQAKRFFAKGDAAFRQPWTAKTVFIFPPAPRRFLNRIPKKFLKEWSRCNIKQAIFLLDTSSPGGCYDVLVERADAVCLTDQPILFLTPSGGAQTSGVRQAFIYFGPDPGRFRQALASVGTVRVDKKPSPRPSKKRRRRQPDRRSK